MTVREIFETLDYGPAPEAADPIDPGPIEPGPAAPGALPTFAALPMPAATPALPAAG